MDAKKLCLLIVSNFQNIDDFTSAIKLHLQHLFFFFTIRTISLKLFSLKKDLFIELLLHFMAISNSRELDPGKTKVFREKDWDVPKLVASAAFEKSM